MLNNTQRALVLGGGGFMASSWITGLITGMAEAGIDVRDADLMIGTSSGARVALQLASGASMEEVFARQAGAGRHFGARPQAGRPSSGALDMSQVQAEVARAKASGGDRAQILQRYGQLALTLAGPEPQGKTPLSMEDWPQRRIQLIALNAATGLRRAFDRESGIPLADAVRATTASFGASPVWFEGQPYIDGGYHSSDNADLAAECGRVLVLALKAPSWALRLVSVEEGVAELRTSGAEVELIQPDDEAMEVITSVGSPMNPAVFEPVTHAGRAQGLRVAAQRGMLGFW